MIIVLRSLPDKIKVSPVTGIRIDEPSKHYPGECYACLSGDSDHARRDWDSGIWVYLQDFTNS